MALPNSKITITKVANTLSSSSTNLGTLATHPNVNKKSRHKPYPYASVKGIYGTSGTDDTIIKDINFGLDPYVISDTCIAATSTEDLAQQTTLYKWREWSTPHGNSTEPYRLGDFRGYNHVAKPWIDYIIFESSGASGGNNSVPLINPNGGELTESGDAATNLYWDCYIQFNWTDAEIFPWEMTVTGGDYDNVSMADWKPTLILGHMTSLGGGYFGKIRVCQPVATLADLYGSGISRLGIHMQTGDVGMYEILTAENGTFTATQLMFAPPISDTEDGVVYEHGEWLFKDVDPGSIWGVSPVMFGTEVFGQHMEKLSILGGTGEDDPQKTTAYLYGHLYTDELNTLDFTVIQDYVTDKDSGEQTNCVVVRLDTSSGYPQFVSTSGSTGSNAINISLYIQAEVYETYNGTPQASPFMTAQMDITTWQQAPVAGQSISFVDADPENQHGFALYFNLAENGLQAGTEYAIKVRLGVNQEMASTTANNYAVLASDNTYLGLETQKQDYYYITPVY